MPPIVRLFRERLPQVEVVLRELTSPTLEHQILSEDVDVGLVLSTGAKVPGLAYETIHQEGAAVALPKDHPLAGRATIALRELADQPFVIYARSAKRQSFDEFVALCHLAGFSPTIAQEAATESAVIGFVAAGIGVTLVASSLNSVRPDEVAYRQLVDPPVTIELAVVWKDGKQLPLVQELRQIAREVTQRDVIVNSNRTPLVKRGIV